MAAPETKVPLWQAHDLIIETPATVENLFMAQLSAESRIAEQIKERIKFITALRKYLR